MSSPLRPPPATATATLEQFVDTSAHAEERIRFHYLSVAVIGGAVLMSLGYLLLGDRPIALTGVLLASVMLGLRAWGLNGSNLGRLQQAVHITTAVLLAFQFWQVLILKEAIAGWYMTLLPLGIAIFCGNRATYIWVGVTAAAIVFLAWAEPRFQVPRPEQAAAPLTVVARCVMMLIITIFGIAARRTRDQHIQDLNSSLLALRRAQQEAERANQAKSAFLATMSHELRTPLNAVIGLNSLMLESDLPTLQRQQAGLACQAGETMLHLVNEILDFSRIESGRLELDRQVFSPRQLLEECLALVAPRAAVKQLTLRSDITVPPALRGDATRLRQILLNLLTNAIKFTASGEVLLRCCEQPAASGSWLYIEVRDTGIGVTPEAQGRIFQPFEQADASTTRLFGGTGLGLAICKGLTVAMGGKIGVNSAPGRGSTFWLELPFEEAPAAVEPAPAPARPSSATAAADAGPARILLAEDNSTNQFVARQMFRKLGYALEVVGNGAEAVAALQRQRYDIVFMDCHMPEMDGLEACRAIRAQEEPARRVPIVAMTALAFDSDREKCLQAGMDDFLPKPVRIQELATLLARWLPGARLARSWSAET